ncbi:MAG: S8 family serine peptidase [Halobacteriovoraceae bacterium]|nr:S8 family serine peptidase [Halobacteriovoraceae bacterium]MCB9095808.1 S8 family serine peptidase [Halobacteriovoraceae bacterium]
MMKYFLFIFILCKAWSQEGSDPLSNYQWALNNTGAMFKVKKNIVDFDFKQAKQNFDVGWIPFQKKFATKLQKEVVIAVIDSGVDYQHPDLKDQIAKNLSECNELGLPVYEDPKDNNGNGYTGDCLGWNFYSLSNNEILSYVESLKLEGEAKKEAIERLRRLHRNPHDNNRNGHGTHIAGIIAASIHNSVGVSGVSSKFKILPIKIFDDPSLNSSTIELRLSEDISKRKSLSSIIAEGLNYAIKNNVDVINLSFGWNRENHTEALDTLIKEALKRNIAVVSAAGNKNSRNTIYPCIIPGVICVGSVNPFGEKSADSNFGMQVDIMAPGYDILSTFPQTVPNTNFFLAGYNKLSGTSQATPFVSAAVAIIKSAFPGISYNEMYLKLLNSTTEFEKNGNGQSLSGLVRYDQLFKTDFKRTVFPQLKGIDKVIINDDGTAKLYIPFRNYGASEKEIQVTLRSSKFALQKQEIFKISAGAVNVIPLEFVVKDFTLDNRLDFTISLSEDQKERIYHHRVKLFRNPNFLNQFMLPMNFSIEKEDTLHPLLSLKMGTTQGFVIEKKEQKGSTLQLVDILKSKVIIKARKFIANLHSIQQIIATDLNYDGKNDILLLAKIRTADSQMRWKYFYLNDQLENLFTGQSEFWFAPSESSFQTAYNQSSSQLKISYPFDHVENLDFLPITRRDQKIMAVPVYKVINSFVPFYQQEKSSFDFYETLPEDHLYYTKPIKNGDEDFLVPYSLTDKKFRESIDKTYGEREGLRIFGPLRENCLDNECSEFLIQSGSSFYKKLYRMLIGLNGEYHIKSMKSHTGTLPSFQSEILKFKATSLVLDNQVLFRNFDNLVYFNPYQEQHLNTELLQSQYLHSFLYQGQYQSFFIGKGLLFLNNERTTAIEEYDFIPPEAYTSIWRPLAINHQGNLQPALINIKAPEITGSGFETYLDNNGQLESPIALSFMPKRECSDPLDLSYSVFDQKFHLNFICRINSQFQFLSLPLTY